MTKIKKIGLGFIGGIVIFAIYYFSAGQTQLANKLKMGLNTELATLKTHGFSVEERKIANEKEHFVLCVKEPKKISAYLTSHGTQVSTKDIETLKGMKIGIDVIYLSNAYSVVSFDMYPTALPDLLTSNAIDADTKKAIEQMQKMLKKKTFLMHIDINKLANGFKGYLKDINETIDGKTPMTFSTKKLKFSGTLEKGNLKSVKQTLKSLNVHSKDDNINITLNNLKSNYKHNGDTNYDYTIDYSIKKFSFAIKNIFHLQTDNITINSSSKVKDALASIVTKMKIDTIGIINSRDKSTFETIVFEMKANNFDPKAMKKLDTINPKNEKELLDALQELISHGIHLEIPNFSVKNIVHKKQSLEGFKITSSLDTDKTLNLAMLKQNQISAMNAVNADLKLTLSSKLLGVMAKQPQAMLVMMLFQPEDINGKKVYKIKLKNGTVSINNKPMF